MTLRARIEGSLPVTAPLVLNPLMAKMAEAAGFAAIEIEDQLVPKRAHHHIGIEHMIPTSLMAAPLGREDSRRPGLSDGAVDRASRRAHPGAHQRALSGIVSGAGGHRGAGAGADRRAAQHRTA
jgi:hypothetical protein